MKEVYTLKDTTTCRFMAKPMNHSEERIGTHVSDIGARKCVEKIYLAHWQMHDCIGELLKNPLFCRLAVLASERHQQYSL